MSVRVAASEAALIAVVRAVVGGEDPRGAQPYIGKRVPLQPQISSQAMALVKQTFARGVPQLLARMGGWKPLSFVRDGDVKSGRAWERSPEIAFHYSAFSYRLLRWLVETPLIREDKDAAEFSRTPRTIADELVLYAVARTFPEKANVLFQRCAPIRASALCALAYPTRTTRRKLTYADYLGDPLGTLILEAMQDDLAKAWTALEFKKASVQDAAKMKRIGKAQGRVLDSFLAAIDAAGRRDLARFLPRVLRACVSRPRDASSWTGSLKAKGKLSSRVAARKAAGQALQYAETMRQWAFDAQAVQFFEEAEYRRAQLFLECYEQLGDRGVQRAKEIRTELEGLGGVSGESDKKAKTGENSA